MKESLLWYSSPQCLIPYAYNSTSCVNEKVIAGFYGKCSEQNEKSEIILGIVAIMQFKSC